MKFFVILMIFIASGCGRVADNSDPNPGSIREVTQDSPTNGIEDKPATQAELDKSLRIAVRASATEMARIALKNGANPDITIDGIRLVSYVTKDKQYTLLRLLLEYKADVNLGSEDGNFPIHHAVINESIRCLRILLDHKQTSVNIYNTQRKTALEIAMERSLIEYALLILRHSPDVSDIPKKLLNKNNQASHLIQIIRQLQLEMDESTFIKIIEDEDEETLDYLTQYFDKDELCFSEDFLLLTMKAAGQNRIYQTLVQVKKLKSFGDYEVFNLLRWAIDKLSYDQLKELVSKFEFIPVDYVDQENKTLLSYAIESLNVSKVIFIRSLGSSTQFTSNNKTTNNCDYLPRRGFNRQRITISRIRRALGC